MVDVLKIKINFSLVLDGIEVGVTNLNKIYSGLSCPGQIVFAVIINDVHQRLNVINEVIFLYI